MPDALRAAVLTISDGVAQGVRADSSGDLLAELLLAEGFEVDRRIVPDERGEITAAIRDLARAASVVLTTGGTGLTERDVTPEATADVVELWPANYMAMFHAGMAEFAMGHDDVARERLERFLVMYSAEDVWRSRARRALADIAAHAPLDRREAHFPE